MLIRLITRTLLLSFHMSSQRQIPRLVCDLGTPRLPSSDHEIKIPAPSRSSALFTLHQKQSAKEQSLTPFFSAPAPHSLLTLFALAEISPALATLTKNMPGIPTRSPQKQHYTVSQVLKSEPMRAVCRSRQNETRRRATTSESSISFTSSTSFTYSTSSASVAAASPRCHTFLSTAARIFSRHASVSLGCAHWGFYGIA